MNGLHQLRKDGRALLLALGSLAAVAAGVVPEGCAGERAPAVPMALRLAAKAVPLPGEETGRVVRVVDGDTYDVLVGGVVCRVRLLGADAPELGQPFGRAVADSVGRVLGGRLVRVRRFGLDLYGRTLATVRGPVGAGAGALEWGAVDSVLVVRGWAWAWVGDAKRRGGRNVGRITEQAAAVAGRRGLWKCGAGEAVPPRLWRHFDQENKRRYAGSCTW